MSVQSTEELSPTEELFHIQESTNDDGTVNVEILGWEKEDDRVDVKYRTPTMETVTESMQWPQKDSSEYKFVRLVRHCGFDLHGADQIEGCTVKFESGAAIVPEQKTRREKVTEKIRSPSDATISAQILGFILWPFLQLIVYMMWVDNDIGEEDLERGIIITNTIWIIWLVLIFSIWYFF